MRIVHGPRCLCSLWSVMAREGGNRLGFRTAVHLPSRICDVVFIIVAVGVKSCSSMPSVFLLNLAGRPLIRFTESECKTDSRMALESVMSCVAVVRLGITWCIILVCEVRNSSG
ncbi:hypothetical protein BV20DRAFT_427099 [Pilatotrama ljubarskyi]|nr:hypothetical protein BV20DRAFT_427099 [Pilatotrama ljubarskyi]